MASSIARNEWIVVVDAPLNPKQPMPPTMGEVNMGEFVINVKWGVDISYHGISDIKGELELYMEIGCDKTDDEPNFRLTMDAFDKNGVLRKMRDSHGDGLYSIAVDIKFLNRTISNPRLAWDTGNRLTGDDQSIPWVIAMELLCDKISDETFTVTIWLKYEREKTESEESEDDEEWEKEELEKDY